MNQKMNTIINKMGETDQNNLHNEQNKQQIEEK